MLLLSPLFRPSSLSKQAEITSRQPQETPGLYSFLKVDRSKPRLPDEPIRRLQRMTLVSGERRKERDGDHATRHPLGAR